MKSVRAAQANILADFEEKPRLFRLNSCNIFPHAAATDEEMSSRSGKLLSPSSAQSVFIEVIKSALDRHGSLLRSHLLYLPPLVCSRLSRILCALDFNLFIVLAVEVVLADREISLSLLRVRERER